MNHTSNFIGRNRESGRNYEVLGLYPAGAWFGPLQIVENTATMFVDFLRLSKRMLV